MMDDELRTRLGIKPWSRVCLFRTPKELLPVFTKGDLKLTMNYAEEGCDTVLFWPRQGDDIGEIFAGLEQQIQPNGRIWLIMPKKEVAPERGFYQSWTEIQQAILARTNLVDNETLSFGNGEYGTQFVIRKEAREG